MLKNIDRKEPTEIFYTSEYSVGRRIIPQKVEVGELQFLDEEKRSYLVVNAIFHVFSYDGVAAFAPLTGKETLMRIGWRGYYFINKDLTLITPENVYECWLDTAKEIQEFLNKNGWYFDLTYPTLEEATDKMLEFINLARSTGYENYNFT